MNFMTLFQVIAEVEKALANPVIQADAARLLTAIEAAVATRDFKTAFVVVQDLLKLVQDATS